MKKYLYTVIGFISVYSSNTFARDTSTLEGKLLPDNLGLPGDNKKINDTAGEIGGDLISTFIQYVAIIAVISLMLSGIMYLVANGEEEKTKKAKSWITWSLIGVLLSISAWGIIDIINNLTIT